MFKTHIFALVAFAVVCSVAGVGYVYGADIKSLGFVAPQAAGTGSVVGPASGEIVFDTNNNSFKGYDGTNWLVLSTASEMTLSAKITISGSTCSATGAWITSCSYINAGEYDLNITGTFSSAPNCVMSTISSDRVVSKNKSATTTTTVSVISYNPSTGTNTDQPFYVMCTGPQ